MKRSRRSGRVIKSTLKANDPGNEHPIRKSRKTETRGKNRGATRKKIATRQGTTEAGASEEDTSSVQATKPASAILALDIGTATCTAQWVVQIGDFRSKPVQLSFETGQGGQKDMTEIPTEIAAVFEDQDKQFCWKFVHEAVGLKNKAILGNLKRAFADREQPSSGEAHDCAARDGDATALDSGQRTYTPRSGDFLTAWNIFKGIGVDENLLQEEITPPNALAKFVSRLVQLFKDQILDAPLADEEYRQKTKNLTINDFNMTLRVAVPSHYEGTTSSRFVELAQSAGIERVEDDLEIAAVCTSLSKEMEKETEIPATDAIDSYIVIDGGGGNIVVSSLIRAGREFRLQSGESYVDWGLKNVRRRFQEGLGKCVSIQLELFHDICNPRNGRDPLEPHIKNFSAGIGNDLVFEEGQVKIDFSSDTLKMAFEPWIVSCVTMHQGQHETLRQIAGKGSMECQTFLLGGASRNSYIRDELAKRLNTHLIPNKRITFITEGLLDADRRREVVGKRVAGTTMGIGVIDPANPSHHHRHRDLRGVDILVPLDTKGQERVLRPSVTLIFDVKGQRTLTCEFDVHESNRSPTDDPDFYKPVDRELYPLWGNINSIMPWSEEIEENFYCTCTIDLDPPQKINKEKVVEALVRVSRLLEGGKRPRFLVHYKWILEGDKEAQNDWISYGIAPFDEGDIRQPGAPDVPLKLSKPPIHSEAANRCWLR